MTKIDKQETFTEHIEKKEIDSSSEVSENQATAGPRVPVIKSDAERKFIKKLNWTLLPIAWAIVFIQFADKAALSKAAVLGMLKDTNTTKSQYSLLGSIFYVGFILFQIPNAYLIQRLPTSKYLGSLIVCWGISVIGTAFCQNYAQLMACRVLLGFFEAATYPCLLMTLTSLYRRQEQSACLGFLWMSNGSGTIFSVIVTYGIVKTLDGVHGIQAWRWNYLVFGIITVVIGIITFIFLIDTPYSKWLKLTEEEKKIVEERIQDNAVVKDKVVKIHHYWEALREPRYYLIVIAAIANNLSNGGLVTFSTPFIATLGFVSLDAILLQIPSATMSVLFIFLAVFLHRKTGKLSIASTVSGLIAMLGCLLLAVLPHTAVKLLGYYLTWAYNGTYVVLLTIIASNVSGYSKKVFYNASVMVAYTVGNFVGPLVMLDNEAPVYLSGMIVFIIGNFVIVVCLLLSVYLMHRVNKQRLANGVSKTDAHLDLTDKEDPNFIYKL
ncbi:major facilitator superfamily domain-containing protein [Cunninghamella echinulata]|nr:major facilitator superfamily domain-containing protein [Cunninghamella echinulata]